MVWKMAAILSGLNVLTPQHAVYLNFKNSEFWPVMDVSNM